MADYRHEPLFGTFLTPAAERAGEVVALAQLAEQAGLDLVTVQDHPYQARFLDTWTLLSVIAAKTSTIRVSPDVANLPLRPPAVLAKSVASLDLLSGGRVELGLGAGGFWEPIAAYGGARLGPARGVDALAEAIRIIRAIWNLSGGAVRVDGEYYRVWGAHPGPAPAHDVGIWLGAYKKRMLTLTGELADGWLPSSPYAPPEQLPRMNRIIDEAAERAGRDPSAIRRLYNLAGSFTSRGTGFLTGPPAVWAEQLAELALEQGMSGFIAMGDDPDFIRRYAGEVAPAVRELVAKERRHPKALNVEPTRDDGIRLSAETPWDESTRPTGPAPDPDRQYTDRQRASARHLIEVHDHLRHELRTVRDLVEQVAAGQLDAGTARSALNEMAMRQNNWTLGAFCETYCRVVTTHHTLEDASLFPQLRRADPALGPVLDRLREEHHTIHGVLDQVDRALVALVSEPDGMKAVRAAVDLLTDTLLSHLSYEERELIEPLARLAIL